MFKKVLKVPGIFILLAVVFLLGTISAGVVFAQSPDEGQASATISTTEAEAIALGANPGASVVDTELQKENGVLVYGVELSNGSEVKVDANSGAILQTELNNNNDADVNNNDDRDVNDNDDRDGNGKDDGNVQEEHEDGNVAQQGIED